MAGQYDAILDEEKGAVAPAASPYDAVLDQEVQSQQQMARTVFEKALAVNPDQAAQSKKLTNTTGLPLAVIERNLDEVKRKDQARMLDLARMAQDSPVLARQILDPTFTNQAHDHLDKLSALEQTFNVVRSVPAGAVRGVGSLVAGSGELIDIGARATGLTAVSRAVKDLTGADLGVALDVAGSLKFAGSGWKMLADAIGVAPEDKNFATDVGEGIGQLVQQIGVQIATGGTASLVSLFSQGADAMADKTRKDDASQALKDTAVLAGASVTALTEKYGVDALLNRVPPAIKNSALRWVADKFVAAGIEASQEVAEGVLQDIVRKALTNSDAKIGENVAYEAGVAGTSAAIVRAALGVRARGAVDQQRGTEAEQAAEHLQQQFQLASQTLLRERNPDEFRALVQKIADNTDGAPTDVYVDAEVLNQLAPEVLAQLPGVAAQMQAALAANDVVSIPVADVLTVAPGTPLEAMLVENARIGDPSAMSQAEAKDAGAKAQEFLAQEAQRVIAQATDQQAMQDSSDRVRQGVLDQLNTVGRFRKDVNEAYATWTAAFYTTMGGRLGITPEEMQAKYPLKIAGQAGQGAVLNAGGMEGELTVEGYHFSMADRPTLSTAMYGTGLKGSARDEILNNPDQRLKKRLSFYFDKGTGIRPESGVGGRAHRVQLTGVYDADADPLKLRTGNARELESKLLDLGYKGYANRMDGTQPGQVIMLGEQNFTPELLGAVSRIDTGQRVAPLETAAPQWQTQASGDPAMLQAKLERMQGMPGWANYDLRIEGNELQVREKPAVFEQAQKAGKTVPVAVDAVANVESAFALAGGQTFKTNRDLKLAIQERVLEALKNAKVSLEDFNSGAEDYLVRVALMDAEIALATNPNAVGWYNEKVTKALRLMALVHPEIETDRQAKFAFVWAMAVTSNGLKVDKNFELAERAYSTYKATGLMPTDLQAGQAQAAINNGLSLYNSMLAKHGFEQLEAFMTTKTTVKEINGFAGLEVGGENLTTEVYGSSILGPKIGNGFFSNLYGKFEQLTMDRWLMRTWGRWSGTLIEDYREQARTKRVQLRALIQALDKDQKKAFEAIIKRKLNVGEPDAVALAIWKASQKPANRVRMAAIADATDEAGQIRLIDILGPLKKGVKRVSFGDEMRKVGNNLTKYLDGQKEAPSGPKERGQIRKVFNRALTQLQERYPALTMSDLQALLWYPEKRLYDAAKEEGEGQTGYDDDEAPDYANAAAQVARTLGVSDEDINRTIKEVDDELQSAERARGAGRANRGVPAGQPASSDTGEAGAAYAQAGEVNGQSEQTGDRGGRYSSGGLAPLEGAPDVRGATGPDPRLVAVAEQYARDNGIELKRQGEYAQVDPARAARIAQAYAEMQHAPNDPQVKAAYADLIRQTQAQYEALVAAGYTFTFFDDTTDPYGGNPWDAMRDLRANQRMAVYGTYAGFGVGADINVGLADPAGGANLDPEAVLAAVRAAGGDVVGSVIHTSATEPTLVIKIATKLDDAAANDLSVALGQEAIAQSFEDGTGQLYGPQAANWGDYSPDFFVTADGRRASETLNPLLADTGLRWPDQNGVEQPVKANDLFRAVHDAFGHGLEGAGFRAQGEENAWQAHVRLFTGPAVGAITSETRGQNNWLNFGPYGERNQTAAVQDTVFAEQKTGLLPEWVWTEGRVADAPDVLKQGPRGTFNPKSLELALNSNADLSSFLHETGHFFLEVMADLASQPGAPADITADMNALMKWFGIKGGNTYQGMSEDEYIARINSGSKTREFNEAMPLSAFAEIAPTGPAYDTVGDVTLAPGAEGAVLAIVDGKVVGYMAPEADTTGLFVADEFRGRGIGETLSTFYRTQNPLAPSGGFSAGGEAIARKVFRKLAAQESGPAATWNVMSLDQKRPYHERFAESFEQYLMEGKAPSLELQPLFRKFRAWMLNVYKSLKAFVDGRTGETQIQLSAEIRQVFDRMLASEEQIAQANEVAGLLPNEEADAEANEKLTARSLRDLKWTVNARAKAIKALQKQAATLRKEVEAEVTLEVNAMPEFQAKEMLDKTRKENKEQLNDTELAIIADAFGYPSVDDMLRAIDGAGKKADLIEGMTDQRMLERHGDLIDQRAIEQAANEAVHNEARARSLATELRSQAEMLNQRTDTGQTNAKGSKITVNAIVEAAKQFASNVIASTPLRDLKAKAWQHTAAERRAGKRWQEATAAGKTQDAVKAKQDQVLNNAAAKAAMDAQLEMRKILEFFKRVLKDNNEKVVDKGRDPDVVNAARAVLAAYGVAPKAGKTALEYMALVEKNDPAMFAALQPSVQGALNMAQPLDALTMEELRGLHEEIQAMWHLAKRSRQMEVDGNMMDLQDAEDELQARMQTVGVPLTMPGEFGAMTTREELARKLQFAGSLLRRVEQWAEGLDGKFGGPFLKLVFQPVKDAANRYRADRVTYRKAYQALVDNVAPSLTKGLIEAPELGYTFGKGHNGIGHAELLHAILHTGNESNKRKLLLGRGWATENADGTLDTSRWDAFLERAHDTGLLNKAHYDFAQGVWDLLEKTKPLAQKTHRDVFGRYFAEVTADSFDTPFGSYAGGYVPAQADPRIVQDADLRKLAEAENENMSFSFPGTNKGFTKGRVDYNRPLMLDLRTIGQHIDKVLLFSHMEPAVRDVQKLLSRKGVSYSLGRIDPTVYAGMLTPWLNRSARQVVETPIVGDGGISRVLSAARNRAGMALMFANVSNTIQQLTGFSTAAIKVKPSSMMAATAQFIAGPKKMAKTVSDASEFMANRMENEIAAINDAMDQILLDPNVYEKAQAWTQKHAYFLQTAMANTMEPIIWTGAYNDALAEGQSEKDAVRYADNVVRTTQGSTLPEDVSRIETGPAYARIFTQFIGYFNMMANTNATALKQISQEMGLKKGAGKALGVVAMGMLVPLWIAEAIAQAMRGGPEDEDKDGYLDDWLAAVFGMGTIKGTFAMVPFVGQLANAAMNRFNGNPADDKMSLSPAVSILESAVGVPVDVYKAITDPDKLNKRNAVRDVASLVSIATGLPAVAVARPLGYLAGVASDKIDPTSNADLARGLVTGSASPESK